MPRLAGCPTWTPSPRTSRPAPRRSCWTTPIIRPAPAPRARGMQVEVPQAGLYLWPCIPAGQASTDFALNLLERTGVAVTPGTNFGSGGEGYVRISLTVPDAQLDEAVARMSSAIGAGRA